MLLIKSPAGAGQLMLASTTKGATRSIASPGGDVYSGRGVCSAGVITLSIAEMYRGSAAPPTRTVPDVARLRAGSVSERALLGRGR